ncbi:YjjG family noncanonical pyrimidine nucleotidase [Sphingomonas carotinifaciens]|uniref:YjjG family noncanonical pyrimidine nucleotidase n=1 Tax=Sphingomonas carotinifaciens TaxID=1166323 RepID=UPI0039A34CCC
MKYRHFLLDLDDTLLDFRASERMSFHGAMTALGLADHAERTFVDYQRENMALWGDFERGIVSKEHLKVERFRRTFGHHALDADPEAASSFYLAALPESVVLLDGALELCAALAAIGEVGIITNGIEAVQAQRIERAGLSGFLSFVATSETCGFAKPDERFFTFASSMFRHFTKDDAIIIGDRLDADIEGARRFGIDSCWFNPRRTSNTMNLKPTFEVARLVEVVAAMHGRGREIPK